MSATVISGSRLTDSGAKTKRSEALRASTPGLCLFMADRRRLRAASLALVKARSSGCAAVAVMRGQVLHGQGAPVGEQGPQQDADQLYHAHGEAVLSGWNGSSVAVKSIVSRVDRNVRSHRPVDDRVGSVVECFCLWEAM